MANSKGSQNMAYPGKLPPKSPFNGFCTDFSLIGSKAAGEGNKTNHHHRTSSESFLIEEQPSWLDDLLNEPETPVRRGGGHRRSSSDSFAYVDVPVVDYTLWDGGRFNNNSFSGPPKESNYLKSQHVPFYPLSKPKNRTWGSLSDIPRETQKLSDAKKDVSMHKGSSDISLAKSAASEAETKRARQQFAQRSRVRKIQYISELERNVQMLQVEGSQVSAELEFLNQQNLILSLENKALKKRLESLAQDQLIKYLEHEVLEKEIVRLRALYQLQEKQEPQQNKKQGSSSHQRSKSRDLESQFTNLSLRP